MDKIRELCREIAHPEWYYDRIGEYGRLLQALYNALKIFLEANEEMAQ